MSTEAILSAPRDHTGDALCAVYHSAEMLLQYARDNVAAAARNLELAKLAEGRAGENAHAAGNALRAHNPGLYDRTEWLIKGTTPFPR